MPIPDPDLPVDALPNIGPKSAAWLREVGLGTHAALAHAGAAMAYRMVTHHHPGATVNLLWALHGALHGQHWSRVSPADKARLRVEAEGALIVRLGSPQPATGSSSGSAGKAVK